jgi:peptidyl-dipeptidase A
MLEPGFSKPWPQSLNLLTGSDKMDASSLMTYFQPLYNWLRDANKVAKDCPGWEGKYFDESVCLYR